MGNPYDIENDPIYQEELAKAYKEYGVGAPQAPQQEAGFKSAFKNALGSQVQGAGQIASDLGWQDNPTERYGKSVQDANPMSIRSLGDIIESPWQATKEATGMALGYIAPAMLGRGLQVAGGAMKLAGLLKAGVALNTLPAQAALAAVPSYGGIREEQEAGGHNDLADIGMAALGAGTVGAIETKFGAQKMLGLGKGAVAAPTRAEFVKGLGKTPLATMGKVMGRTVAEEMGEELAQNPIEQLASYQNPLTAENINETLTGSALAGLGTIGLGGAGGARMAMRHKGINDFRQQDLLNNPSASIGHLADQAQWDREFLAREVGEDEANRWYENRMNELNDTRLGSVTTWNEPLADYQARVAESADLRMGEGLSVDLLNENFGIGQKPVKQQYARAYNAPLETPIVVSDDSGNPITLSTVGEEYDYRHRVGKFSPQVAKVDALGYPLSPYQPVEASQQVSTTPSWAQYGIDPTPAGETNVIPQVAQGSNQVQGGNAVGSTGTVGLGNSATDQRDGVGRTAVAPAGPGGTTGVVGSTSGGVGAVNPATAGFGKKQLAAWNDAVAKLGEGHPALEVINEAITKNKLPVAQKALNEALAPAKIEALSEVKLPKVQQKVFDYMLTAARENNLDAVVDSEGTFKSTEIAEALGLKKGSALAAITGAQKHLATQLGFGSVDELKTFLKNRTSEVRTTQESDAANLGMSPAVQNNQVVNDADLFGNSEAGTEQNMGIINSVGGSQGETEGLRDGHRDRDLNEENLRILRNADRTKNDAASSNVQTAEEVAREERIKAEAKARADAQNKAVLATNEAKTAAVDWDDFKSNTTPNFSDLTEQAQASWVVQYVETVSNDSSNEAIESAQRDFERQLEPTDVRSETQGSQNRPTAELGRTSEGGQGTLAAPVQKAEPTVTTKKRRIAKPEEGVTGKTQFSESTNGSPTAEQIDAWENGMLTLDEFLPNRFPAVDSMAISYPGPGGRITPKAIRGAAFYRETNGEGLFDLLAYDKQFNFNRTFVATNPDIALGQGGNTGIKVTFRSKSLSGTENAKPGTGKIAGREYVTEVIAPRAVLEVSMPTAAEKSLRPLVKRVLTSEFTRAVENGRVVFTRKVVYSRQETSFSEGKTDQGIEPQKLAATLRKYFFSPEKFNKLVSIFPNAEAIPADVKAAAAADAHMSVNDVPWEEVQGFAMNGKVYLVASNIKEGNELGVFLHELGVHVGMERLIGKSNMSKLSSQIEQWAAKDNGSKETKLAKDAVRRAEGSASEDQQQEVIAYFVEEAVKAGINPVAVQKTNSPLAQWFRSLWAAAKLALRKIGFGRFDQLTAQNIVDLAYGAANIELQAEAVEVNPIQDKVKFSQADVTKTNPQYRQASTLVKQLIEYAGNKLQSLENNLMFGHQLAEKAARLMPGTASYFKSAQNRQTERVKHEQEIARIANLYNELDTKQQNALNSFVQKSTMDGKWGFKPTWFEKDVQTTVDATAKTQFDALSPEAQQIAKDMFKFGSEQQKRFDESVNANIDDPKQKVQRNQMYGKPYAPLKRFGDHVVVGKSAQFLAEEKENPGSKRLAEMKADPNHYYVEFTDGNLEAIQRRDTMAAANPNLAWESKPLQLEAKALNSVNFTVLEKLKKQIEASDNKSTEATKGALKSLANQLYIQQLNQLHANKSQAQRLNVKGADTDMMRAFVTQGRAEAALIANLRTHAETESALQQIQKAAREGDNQDTKTRIANAVLRRHLAMLDFKPTPIQNKLMGLNSFYMLLTSPAYYLTNSTQPFVVTLPYMAGRFGGANSWNTLRDAYKTTLDLVKLSTLFKNQNLDKEHLKKFDSVGRESDALQTLLDENLVNIGMEMELGDISNQSKNPTMKHVQKGMQVLKTGVANVEVLNRLSSAVAGYRLAYTEAVNNKLSPEDAHNAGVEYARKVIIDTHGDYAGYNAPTVMMQGAFGNLPVKLMTQFKKFQFIQAGLLIGTFRDAYMRGNLNDNEKAAARAMFKWMLGTQAALAGALGGVTGIPMAILGSMAAGAFGDDGEDKEAYLRRILGGGAFAQLILHGAPAAAGVDISKRVGMGAALDPFRMADPQTDWSDYALSLAGPSAGLASRFGSGMSYLGKGQYWKGLEMMMPSGVITNASKVARYESEGLTNSRGDVVMKPEEVSLMTDLMQSLGLETTQLSDRRWKAEAVYDRGVHFKEKTSQLQRDYVEAVKDQDQSTLNEIRKDWMELQAERVKQGFKRENMSTLTHAPMAQKKRERDTIHGLQSTATNKKFVQSIDGL